MSGSERISIIAPILARLPGGGARTYYQHANALAEKGYQVTVVHGLDWGPGLRGRVEGLLRGKVRDLKAGNLRRKVSWMSIDPRVKMAWVRGLDPAVRLPAADLRIATYWETTEFLVNRDDDGAANMQLIQAYETWAGPKERVDATWLLPLHTVVVSESLYQRGLSMGVPAERLHLAPNGIDQETFRLRSPIEGREATVSFLVHEMPVKGLREAIATCELVHAAAPQVKFRAFGGAARPAILPSFIEYLQKPLGVTLAEQIYDKCSIFLCASQSEGFGFPSLEAMSCGAALVSTRNGGVDDFARDEESALLCDVGDVEGLAAAVERLVGDDMLRTRLAEAGRRIAQGFTWDASNDAFEVAVRTALTSRPQS